MADIRASFGWNRNPFIFSINPELFVGYSEEVSRMLSNIESGCKFSLLLGPTGSGKTTMMKYMCQKVNSYHFIIYLSKPPKDYNDWVMILERNLKTGFFSRIFNKKNHLNIYDLADFVNKKLNGRKCLLMVDEAHEASLESLEWLRTITDQIENLSVILAGLPIFENMMNESLETFMKRINLKVILSNLTKSETHELIRKRIENSGGVDIRPFTQETVNVIYDKTGGFPREIIKMCNDIIIRAQHSNTTVIDEDFIREVKSGDSRISLEMIENLPQRQRIILEILSNKGPLTPSQIVANLDSKIYKDKDNAIRSVNNILRRLMKENLVDRRGIGKSYKYTASEKFKTLNVVA